MLDSKKFLVEEADLELLKHVKNSLLVQRVSDSEYIRASQIYDICPREEVLVRMLGVKRQVYFSAKSAVRIKAGVAFHEAVRSLFYKFDLGNNKIGFLVGKWFCGKCGKLYGSDTDWIRKVDKCDCGSDYFVYSEVEFKDDQHLLIGHVDGIIEVVQQNDGVEGAAERMVLEIKLVGANSFKSYRLPISYNFNERYYHQVQAYMYLSGLRKTLFCVVNVDADKEADIARLFYVNYDDELVEKQIKPKLVAFAEGIRSGTLPQRICISPIVPRAYSCPVAKECFFGSFFKNK